MIRKILKVIITIIIMIVIITSFNKTCMIQDSKHIEKYHNYSTLTDNYLTEIQKQKSQYAISRIKMSQLANEAKVLKDVVLTSRGEDDGWIKVKVTAYDLSFRSCGKRIDNKLYGITATGFNLKGKNYKTARVIAVDKDFIPLKSKVKLRFIDELFQKYDETYSAEDVGGDIVGRHIDLFLFDTGEKVNQKALDFGVTEAYLQIIDKESIDNNK